MAQNTLDGVDELGEDEITDYLLPGGMAAWIASDGNLADVSGDLYAADNTATSVPALDPSYLAVSPTAPAASQENGNRNTSPSKAAGLKNKLLSRLVPHPPAALRSISCVDKAPQDAHQISVATMVAETSNTPNVTPMAPTPTTGSGVGASAYLTTSALQPPLPSTRVGELYNDGPPPADRQDSVISDSAHPMPTSQHSANERAQSTTPRSATEQSAPGNEGGDANPMITSRVCSGKSVNYASQHMGPDSFTETDHRQHMQRQYMRTRRRHYTDPVDFEGILNIIGGCSWWQIFVYALISLQQIPHAMFNLSVVYMMYQPKHWCQIDGFPMASMLYTTGEDLVRTEPTLRQHPVVTPDGKHAVNWTWPDVLQTDLFYPLEKGPGGVYGPSKCRYYNRGKLTYHDLSHLPFEQAKQLALSNATVTECNKWHYASDVMEETIVTEWDLVCDQGVRRAHAHAAYSAGYLVGCILSGIASDRFGRKPTVIGFGVLSSLFGLVLPYSTYFPMFLLLRFFGAVCNEAADLAAYVLCMEITGTKYRAMVGSLLQAPWAVGYALLALVAYLTRSWRKIQLITAFMHTAAIVLVCALPESPRWLIVSKRVRESEQIIRRACRMNKSYLPADLELVKHAEQRRWVKKDERASLIHLYKSRELSMRTLIVFIVWCATALVYYGLVLALSDQSAPDRSLFGGGREHFFVNNAISGALELPTLVACVVIMRYGRKKAQMLTLIAAGIFIMFAMFAAHEQLGTIALVLFMLGKVFIQGAFNILYIFTSEMYPTVIRNTAVGTASMVARLGAGISGYVAILSSITLPFVPMLIFGVFALCAGCLVLFLPETRDQPLPDTLQDAVTFLKAEKGYHCMPMPLGRETSTDSHSKPRTNSALNRQPRKPIIKIHDGPAPPQNKSLTNPPSVVPSFPAAPGASGAEGTAAANSANNSARLQAMPDDAITVAQVSPAGHLQTQKSRDREHSAAKLDLVLPVANGATVLMPRMSVSIDGDTVPLAQRQVSM